MEGGGGLLKTLNSSTLKGLRANNNFLFYFELFVVFNLFFTTMYYVW